MAEPVILELAVNGATPRRRNRHVPRPATIAQARGILGVPVSRRRV